MQSSFNEVVKHEAVRTVIKYMFKKADPKLTPETIHFEI